MPPGRPPTWTTGWTPSRTAYQDASKQDGHVALAAHSLGCWAASAWLNKYPSSQVCGAFMVAPPDRTGPRSRARQPPRSPDCPHNRWRARLRSWAAPTTRTAPPEAAAGFAARWEARWHLAGACGHLNSTSGLGAWQHGRVLLGSLTRQ
ncbi:RBBP9/YdeN family alpha/beta hydrolase [Streptomyces nigra]|uniref:RBBP9/YdeN family alpha/beta hydrolase n=1 Tax=Streptomyces nigra TaxID=1827580 RepID=UPI00380B72C3